MLTASLCCSTCWTTIIFKGKRLLRSQSLWFVGYWVLFMILCADWVAPLCVSCWQIMGQRRWAAALAARAHGCRLRAAMEPLGTRMS